MFIVYTISQLTADLKCSKNTVRKALNELEDLNLIKRQRERLHDACKIFVLIPEGQNLLSPRVKNSPPKGSESGPPGGQILTPSKTDTSYTENSKNEVVNIRKAYGSFNNVFLSDAELESLNELYPAEHQAYIEKLSSYMQRSGRSYGNHYDTILKWLREDIKSYDYSYEEGECL